MLQFVLYFDGSFDTRYPCLMVPSCCLPVFDDSVEAVKLDPKSAAENPETGQTRVWTGENLPAALASDIILVVFIPNPSFRRHSICTVSRKSLNPYPR